MSVRLTAEPGTLEFYEQLLEIAQQSDHPTDKALARVLAKCIGEAEACFHCGAKIVKYPCVHCGGKRPQPHPVYEMITERLEDG